MMTLSLSHCDAIYLETVEIQLCLLTHSLLQLYCRATRGQAGAYQVWQQKKETQRLHHCCRAHSTYSPPPLPLLVNEYDSSAQLTMDLHMYPEHAHWEISIRVPPIAVRFSCVAN